MKNGYMFFLCLGGVTLFARLALVALAVAFFSVDEFFLRIYIGIALFLCLVVSVIKAPSDKDVMRAIERFREGFKEKLQSSRHACSMGSVKVLEAYKVKGAMRMKRTVGRDVIYPHLISLAIAPSPEAGKMILYVDELCLFKVNDIRFSERTVDASSCEISTECDGESVTLTLRCEGYEQGVSFITKNNFHYREFIDAASSVVSSK